MKQPRRYASYALILGAVALFLYIIDAIVAASAAWGSTTVLDIARGLTGALAVLGVGALILALVEQDSQSRLFALIPAVAGTVFVLAAVGLVMSVPDGSARIFARSDLGLAGVLLVLGGAGIGLLRLQRQP